MINQMNDDGYALLRRYEGLRLNAYLCPAGVLTIGYGHTGDVQPMQTITLQDAEALLRKDVARIAAGVENVVNVALNDNQFSALVCFAFNVGLGALSSSTLLNLLNRGWKEQVPAQLLRWTKVHGQEMAGLLARRRAEAQLWNKDTRHV